MASSRLKSTEIKPPHAMKENLRFITADGKTEIRAKLKATGKYATLGFCHPATVALIKQDGIRKHMHLVTIR